MRLTYSLVVLAMVLQGAFLAATLLLPLLSEGAMTAASATAELRRHWWNTSGFAPLMVGVLIALPILAAGAPRLRPGGWLRAGSTTYVLAILGQALMLVVLWRDEPDGAAASAISLWVPGLVAFGLWLLTFSLLIVARRQSRAAQRAVGQG